MGLMQRVTGPVGRLDLAGRTALVIGATAGIGAAVAEQLAAAGARTILLGRDPAKLEAIRVALAPKAPGGVETVLADLADLASLRAAADALTRAHGRFDIVIANASVMSVGRTPRLTRNGYEATFGVNHLGNAALLLALERPIRAAAGRVVIVASEAHRRARGLPLDTIAAPAGYNGLRAYSRSKLANILFARRLATLWPEVTVHAAHPGGVMTDMMRGAAGANRFYGAIVALLGRYMLTPGEAARGIVRVAADPALAEPSGTYFELGRPAPSSSLARDAALGAQLDRMTRAMLRAHGFDVADG